MYNEIEAEFGEKFAETDIDLYQQYRIAVNKVGEPNKQLIRAILNEVLAAYSGTKGKSKVGRFFRWIAKIFTK